MKRQSEKLAKQDSCGHVSYDGMAIDPSKNRLLSYTEHDGDEDINKHPSVEEMFIRQAIKFLTPKQRAIWEYYNYDRLTQDEIATKMRMGQANVAHSIKAIERRITKWCQSNAGAYQLLKAEYKEK